MGRPSCSTANPSSNDASSMISPCETICTEPNAVAMISAIHSRSLVITGRTFIRLPSCRFGGSELAAARDIDLFDRSRRLQCPELGVGATEEVAEHPIVVLAQ